MCFSAGSSGELWIYPGFATHWRVWRSLANLVADVLPEWTMMSSSRPQSGGWHWRRSAMKTRGRFRQRREPPASAVCRARRKPLRSGRSAADGALRRAGRHESWGCRFGVRAPLSSDRIAGTPDTSRPSRIAGRAGNRAVLAAPVAQRRRQRLAFAHEVRNGEQQEILGHLHRLILRSALRDPVAKAG